MAPNAKRVFYVKYLPSPVYSTVLAKRADVQLDKLENDSPDDQVEPILNLGAPLSDRCIAANHRATFSGQRGVARAHA